MQTDGFNKNVYHRLTTSYLIVVGLPLKLYCKFFCGENEREFLVFQNLTVALLLIVSTLKPLLPNDQSSIECCCARILIPP